MHRPGADRVREHQERRHRHLRRDHQRARDPPGLKHLHAHQQVHSLVLCLLEEGVDGSMIPLQGAQAVEVAEPGRQEARHSSEGLEDDQAPLDGLGRRILVLVAGDGVETPVQRLHDAAHDVVAKSDRLVLEVFAGHPVHQLAIRPDVVHLPPAMVRNRLLREAVVGLGNGSREVAKLASQRRRALAQHSAATQHGQHEPASARAVRDHSRSPRCTPLASNHWNCRGQLRFTQKKSPAWALLFGTGRDV
mmetsp:Transcript_16622/g.63225  ORF Transcript_16622/g.63225 Transcript_16622/m.63225 type:complete len:249 (+) Transcript_16622:598-1344(+)